MDVEVDFGALVWELRDRLKELRDVSAESGIAELDVFADFGVKLDKLEEDITEFEGHCEVYETSIGSRIWTAIGALFPFVTSVNVVDLHREHSELSERVSKLGTRLRTTASSVKDFGVTATVVAFKAQFSSDSQEVTADIQSEINAPFDLEPKYGIKPLLPFESFMLQWFFDTERITISHLAEPAHSLLSQMARKLYRITEDIETLRLPENGEAAKYKLKSFASKAKRVVVVLSVQIVNTPAMSDRVKHLLLVALPVICLLACHVKTLHEHPGFSATTVVIKYLRELEELLDVITGHCRDLEVMQLVSHGNRMDAPGQPNVHSQFCRQMLLNSYFRSSKAVLSNGNGKIADQYTDDISELLSEHAAAVDEQAKDELSQVTTGRDDTQLNHDDVLAILHGGGLLPVPVDDHTWAPLSGAYGAYGECFTGERWDNGERIVAKFIRLNTDEQRNLKRFIREILAWHDLQHENILHCLGYCTAPAAKLDGHPFGQQGREIGLVSEYHHNKSLRAFVERLKHSLGLAKRIELLRDVANAVAYLHNMSPPIKHGDIRADNVIVTKDERALLADFGIATWDGMHHAVKTSVMHTNDRWLAYELLQDYASAVAELTTVKTDIFALGCVVLEVLSGGDIPYSEYKGMFALLKARQSHVPPRIPQSVDARCHKLMLQCWAEEPSARPTADAIRQEFNAMLHGLT